jgi:hypothetical protein
MEIARAVRDGWRVERWQCRTGRPGTGFAEED